MNAVRSLSEFYLNDNLRNAMNQDDKNKLIDGLLEKLETKESEEVKSKLLFINIQREFSSLLFIEI